MLPRYFEIPEIVSGYDLGDFFWIVDPEGTTNLCTNPSFETNTTSWTAVGGSIARVATWQTRGVYCLEVTPGAGVNDGAFFGTFTTTTSQWYTLSLDFQGATNRPYKIWFATTGAALLGTEYKFKATGRKQRVEVSWFETGGTTRRIYVTKDNHTNVAPFQIDAVQIENKAYATTYADGDQTGIVVGRADFYWSGAPHASQSVRIDQCGIGGRMYSFKELGFRILSILGLGLAGLQPRLLPQTSGGAFYQDTIITDRQFSIIGQVEGEGLAEVQRKRQAFIELLRPDSVTPSQPVSLHYIPTDNCGEQIGDELEILCIPDGDVLPMQLDNRHAERLSLPFRLYLPFTARDEGEVGAVLDFQDSFANADYIMKRNSSGLWSRLSGASAFNNQVLGILSLSDGRVVIWGGFTNAGGLANADYIVFYDPATDALSALNATPLSDVVRDCIQMPNGNLLIVGQFLNAGADANADYVAQVDINTGAFSSINATPLNALVYTVARLSNGNYAIGGDFTNAGGDANADYVAKITASTMAYSSFNATPISTFTGAIVKIRDIFSTLDGNAIITGGFTDAGGSATADLICRLVVATGAFEALSGTSLASAAGTYVQAGAITPDGQIYFTGNFTDGAGIAELDYAGVYNGAFYKSLSTGFDAVGRFILPLLDGTVLFVGNFTRAGPLTLFDRAAIWNGSAWVMVDIDLPGAPDVQSAAVSRDGMFYIGYDVAGTVLASGVTTITNNGSSKAYPRIKLTGPGTVFQLKNWTTGRSLWFNLTLLAGETAVLDFSNPQNVTFTSNLRGNLLGTILRGSSNDFWLAPNQNSISLFIAGNTDGNTAAVLSWRETFHSLDGAIPVHALP